jgi:hypothetical protein
MVHRSRSASLLSELSKISERRLPLNRQIEYSLDHVRKLQERLVEGDRLVALIRRIGGYLGMEWKKSVPNALSAAKQVRAMIQKGDCDEVIAMYLERYLGIEGRRPGQKRGRPRGATISDGLALCALELHDSDPKQWTWPKVASEFADELPNCKHAAHDCDSNCTVALRKSVGRLRAFLKELQSQATAPPAVK